MKKVKEMVKKFWNDEEGLGIVEILLILAVIIGLALIFRDQITSMVEKIFKSNNDKMDDLLK
ncbi:Flp1 family type IVb pilin [Neobacillus niacini]|jgi:Flp pilus assembly pilin Flp|uniref:Flp1 family type IVb pilin n=1 Tax=Neobacillus niacini TaxID=86668 RepID=UPI001C8DF106|nr:Flp1 family type IVb pilin [Neobacillus niacini]MBY0144972.1 multidrug transporter [Neobacillus niacini]